MSQLVIATRESRLALWQAEHVQALLRAARRTQVALLGMTTRGDQILDRTLSKVGGKGLFVKELETALEEGRADLAVHSLKDVPMELPRGLRARRACWSARTRATPSSPTATPRSTSCRRARWSAPPACAAWCSCSRCGPTCAIEPLRGNLDTRLRKLDEGGYDAIVLAAAGLKRLGPGASASARAFPSTR